MDDVERMKPTVAGLVRAVRCTTATLRLADWSAAPVKHARISETRQPRNSVEIPQGQLVYHAPAPSLQASEEWAAFEAQVRDAMH